MLVHLGAQSLRTAQEQCGGGGTTPVPCVGDGEREPYYLQRQNVTASRCIALPLSPCQAVATVEGGKRRGLTEEAASPLLWAAAWICRQGKSLLWCAGVCGGGKGSFLHLEGQRKRMLLLLVPSREREKPRASLSSLPVLRASANQRTGQQH